MALTALVILIVGLAAIVFEFAVLSVIKASNPWLKALPALVPFAALVATVFFSVSKDTWLTEMVKSVVTALLKSSIALYIAAFLVCPAAIGFGWYVWHLSKAKEGRFTVQIVQKDDIPDQAVPGLPVTLEHKLRGEVLERITDSSGKASFEVDLSDVFAVRVRKSTDPRSPLFVLASDAQVSDKTKTRFELVRLAGIPKESWISRALTTEKRPGVVHEFVRLPAEYFRWRNNNQGQHVIDVEGAPATFPFNLPGAETTIKRRAFTIGFSPILRLPRWVAYQIIRGESTPRRLDRFVLDPSLPASYQAMSTDYMGNDFDRGHLVRRSDLFGLGEKATVQVNYLSAIVPQLSYVNRKTWFELENYTSEKAVEGQNVYVIRGPIYQPSSVEGTVNVTLIGANLVPVPTHFFQILLTSTNTGQSVEAHIVPNTYVQFEDKDVGRFRTTVEEIAAKTGLAFDVKLSR